MAVFGQPICLVNVGLDLEHVPDVHSEATQSWMGSVARWFFLTTQFLRTDPGQDKQDSFESASF